VADRYVLREGSPGGERDLVAADQPRGLLMDRDRMRAHAERRSLRRVYDVIDTDAVDLDEHGYVEWDDLD
jgi:hypothetical protein